MGARLPRHRGEADVSMGQSPAGQGGRAFQRAGWTWSCGQVQSQLFRTLRYRRQRVGMVRGLVRQRLLREVAGRQSQRPGPRHVPRSARRIVVRYREEPDLCVSQLGAPHGARPQYRIPLREEFQVRIFLRLDTRISVRMVPYAVSTVEWRTRTRFSQECETTRAIGESKISRY